MPHFKMKEALKNANGINIEKLSGDFNWKKLDFKWLLSAMSEDQFAFAKTIGVADRADRPAPHSYNEYHYPYTQKIVCKARRGFGEENCRKMQK